MFCLHVDEGGSRTPGHRVQHRVEAEVRSAVWCVWKRTCRARLSRLRTGSAHTLHGPSLNRAAMTLSAQSGWQWNGLRYTLVTHTLLHFSVHHFFIYPSIHSSIYTLISVFIYHLCLSNYLCNNNNNNKTVSSNYLVSAVYRNLWSRFAIPCGCVCGSPRGAHRRLHL